MSFFSEIAARAGLSELALLSGFNIINYSGECVYVEGIKQLVSVGQQEIVLQLKGAVLTLKGESLNLFELSEAAIIKGFVQTTQLVKVNNGGRDEKENRNKSK